MVGDSTVAQQAANDFHTATGGDYGLTAGTDVAAFGYSTTVTDVDTRITVEHGATGFFPWATTDILPATWGYAYAVALVPEIDGNALAQVLMVLFVGYLLLRARRRAV